MTINGKDLEFDIYDAEQAEKFEKAMDRVVQKVNALQKEKLTLSQSIRKQCEAVAEYFDSLFGAGAAAMIFDGKTNLKTMLLAFSELVEAVEAQKEEINKLAETARKKYGSRLK